MGSIKIINNSTLADQAAVMRVGSLLAGDDYFALHDGNGVKIVNIRKQKNGTYLVTDNDLQSADQDGLQSALAPAT